MSRPSRILLHLGVGLACGVGALLAGCGGSTAEAERLPAVDTHVLVIDAAGAASEGDVVSLADIDGPAVINVWATTCAPCVREMPALQAVAADHPDVAFYGLNVTESADAVADFVRSLDITYDQLLDTAGYAQEALAIDSLPTTIIVAADGSITDRHRGEITSSELESKLPSSP